MFLLTDYHFEKVVHLKLDVQAQGDGRILAVDGEGELGGLENWIIFIDLICVSSCTLKLLKDT